MRTLLVYADFDWLPSPTFIGKLGYESLRGTDSYNFCFSEEWLQTYGGLYLSADLNNYTGIQYTASDRDIFGCFSDALPDRWGRTLLLRREQILAQEEKRPLRRLSSFDYLLGIDDYARMGALRFKEDEDGDFINSSPSLRIPPLTDIRTLEAASQKIERSELANELPDKRWIAQLVQPGSSLGGARPKIRTARSVSLSSPLGETTMMRGCGSTYVTSLPRGQGSRRHGLESSRQAMSTTHLSPSASTERTEGSAYTSPQR